MRGLRAVRLRLPGGGRSGSEDELPADSAGFAAVNAEFFGEGVTGWGRPGGWEPEFRTEKDHPAVAAWKAHRS